MTEHSDIAVSDFFSRLLTEPKSSAPNQASKLQIKDSEPELDVEKVQLQHLLSKISPDEIEVESNIKVEKPEIPTASTQEISGSQQIAKETDISADKENESPLLQQRLDDEFQALFFKVAGLTLAVPLVDLGGIIHEVKVNHLPGQPAWIKGVMTNRKQKINVVDTAAWVMPEKYDENLQKQVEYQYVVLLQNSKWGLACEQLLDAESINKAQINWRKNTAKRPWLAGLVKKQMCGILDVGALVEQLDSKNA
ncbi:chemotaxis protein CheW [Parashewanella tropica]|uniref:chemotaxis protein CheW n=1 Tax=Parashewanella tropica TaxID=2547970 RepID=UPI001059A690|nr:chemotaxis protein CheW [Parashewanella tropica]